MLQSVSIPPTIAASISPASISRFADARGFALEVHAVEITHAGPRRRRERAHDMEDRAVGVVAEEIVVGGECAFREIAAIGVFGHVGPGRAGPEQHRDPLGPPAAVHRLELAREVVEQERSDARRARRPGQERGGKYRQIAPNGPHDGLEGERNRRRTEAASPVVERVAHLAPIDAQRIAERETRDRERSRHHRHIIYDNVAVAADTPAGSPAAPSRAVRISWRRERKSISWNGLS